MPISHARFGLVIAAVFLGGGLAARPAAAQQSPNDLRRENQRLRTQVGDLERELQAAEDRIDQLQRDIAELHRLLQATRSRGPATAPAEKVTIDESVPHASPRALFRAIVDSYRQELHDRDLASDDYVQKRAVYLRAIDRWANRVNREMRAPIEWHVRLVEDEPVRSLYVRRMMAVDPKTHVELGNSFGVLLPRGLARRIDEQVQRGDVLVLKGALSPRVRLNQERAERGVFDKPRFIGPFAEFGFTVDVTSLLPTVPEPEEDQETDPDDRDARSPR